MAAKKKKSPVSEALSAIRRDGARYRSADDEERKELLVRIGLGKGTELEDEEEDELQT